MMRVLFIQPRCYDGIGFQGLFQVEPLDLEMIAGAVLTSANSAAYGSTSGASTGAKAQNG